MAEHVKVKRVVSGRAVYDSVLSLMSSAADALEAAGFARDTEDMTRAEHFYSDYSRAAAYVNAAERLTMEFHFRPADLLADYETWRGRPFPSLQLGYLFSCADGARPAAWGRVPEAAGSRS